MKWIIRHLRANFHLKLCALKYTHTKKITSIIIIKRVKEDNRMSTNRRERAFLAQNNKGGVLNVMRICLFKSNKIVYEQ